MSLKTTSLLSRRQRWPMMVRGLLVLLLLAVAVVVRFWPHAPTPAVSAAQPPQTKVRTRAIETLQVGDRITTRDPETGRTSHREVTRVFRRISNHVRRLRLKTDAGRQLSIHTTDEHPFWVLQRGWTPARELVVGSQVAQLEGGAATVEATHRDPHHEGIAVYNLETADDHTYFVSNPNLPLAALLVHNCNPEDIPKLYHYTHVDPKTMRGAGLAPQKSKIFLTPNGRLSPIQAQLGLALPPNRGLPQHLLEIDVRKLKELGIDVPGLTRIGRKYNLPGGELETAIDKLIPWEAIRIVN